MRKSLKRILTAALGALAFVAAGFGVSGLKTANVAKAETAPLEIKGRTLVVSNNVNLSFFVPVEAGDQNDIKVLAREVRAVDGVEEEPVVLSALSAIHEEDTDGNGVKESFYEYKYKGVAAKEMPNVVYAYAYLDSDPTVKSPEKKFSIVEYAHKQLGQVSDKLDTLIKATLDYGEAAAAFEDQTLPADYLNDYKLWKLDESTNATFADGFDYSYVYEGQKVAIQPATNYVPAAGVDYLEDNGDGTYTYTVPAELPNFENVFVDNSDNISDEVKAKTVLDAITVDTTPVIIGDTLELNTTPVDYEDDVTISWEVSGVTRVDNVVTFDAIGEATLAVTVTCGEVVQTNSFTVEVKNTKTYTFSDYPAGTQYADNEQHVLDKYVTVATTNCHFTSELRIYSSSTYDGFAVINTNNGLYITAITINAGNNSDTVKVYGCDDGKSWSEIGDIAVTKTSYNDYTLQIAGGYKYLKLDIAGSQQVRIKNMTLWFSDSNEVSEQAKIEATKAELDAMNLPQTITENYVKDSLPGNGTAYDDIEIVWSIKDAEGNDVSEDIATLDGDLLTIKTPTVDAEVVLCAMIAGQEEAWKHTFVIEYTAPEEPGTGGEEGGDEPTTPTVEKLATFEFGANDNATHVDGNSLGSSKSYTADDYTLALTNMTNVYGPAYDATGNSCIKFGSSKAVGTCMFTVPENVTEVVIYVAKYKANTTKVNINGTTYTLTNNSNDGAYDEIVVDTTTNKTVSFTTVSGGVRAMLNTIVFKGTK